MHYQFSLVKIIQSYFFNDVDRWILWWPVGIGLGISLYFSLTHEPNLWGSVALLCCLGALMGIWPRSRCLIIPFFSIFLGFFCAQWRTAWLNTFMLDQALKQVCLEGIIQEKDYRRGYWRYVIAEVTSKDGKVPQKVRLNDHNRDSPGEIFPGMHVRLLADLYPLPLPVTPYGFDFRRQAYFQGIGATGKVIEMVAFQPTIHGDTIVIFRHRVNQYLQKHLKPIPAALAMTFITGERGLIPETLRGQFTDAGLAHLLAISGLHVGLVIGVIFLLIRQILAFIPWIVERWHIKKIAASLAIPVGYGYLALSGWGIPAQRAFLMVMVFMLAIIIDRQAISMRLVALAATIILIVHPESLLSASFQLSFTAVVALIAAYETKWLFGRSLQRQSTLWQRLRYYMEGMILTTVIASVATLPLTICLFNKFTLVAVIANVLAIPLMGVIIIPLLLVLMCIAPFGEISWITYGVNISLEALVHLAERVSQLPGAVIAVATPHPGFLISAVLGGVWLCLWRQPWRYWGLGLWLLAPFFLLDRYSPIVYATRNTIGIVDETNKVVMILGKDPSSFLRDQWQRDWLCLPLEPVKGLYTQYQGTVVGRGKISNQVCCSAKIIVSSQDVQCFCGTKNQPIRIDRAVLQRQDAVFIWPDCRVQSIRDILGDRPWTSKSISKSALDLKG
jgi:competence protein ComEC